MLFEVEQGRLIPRNGNDEFDISRSFLLILHPGDPLPIGAQSLVGHRLWEETLRNNALRFESRDQIDVLCFANLCFPEHKSRQQHLHILFGENWGILVCENENEIKGLLHQFENDERGHGGVHEMICRILEAYNKNDTLHLNYLEEQIMQLEDAVILGKSKNSHVREIIELRKELIVLKHIYDAMTDSLEDLSANDNGFFEERSLRQFKILERKIERQYSRVLSLQEYVSEIREAYQEQVDIGLNATMKFFTVITSIVLPLTLIAGWYGMNFDMPEYHTVWGYGIVIVISVLIVIAEIIYFKKKHWF